MKSQPETIVELSACCPGSDQFERFERGVRASLGVSKQAVVKEEAREKRGRAKKRAKKSA